MAVETTTVKRVVPSASYPTITWSGVIAGAAVAIALDALFAVLGGAVGASVVNPYSLAGAGTRTALSVGSGLWLVCANLLAFLIGGFVGSRTAVYAGHANGMLQGLTVWAVALVVSVFLASFAMPGGLSGALETAQAGASSAADQSASASGQDYATPDRATMAAMAWWTFAAIGIGALGALAGGRLGAEHLAHRELAMS